MHVLTSILLSCLYKEYFIQLFQPVDASSRLYWNNWHVNGLDGIQTTNTTQLYITGSFCKFYNIVLNTLSGMQGSVKMYLTLSPFPYRLV